MDSSLRRFPCPSSYRSILLPTAGPGAAGCCVPAECHLFLWCFGVCRTEEAMRDSWMSSEAGRVFTLGKDLCSNSQCSSFIHILSASIPKSPNSVQTNEYLQIRRSETVEQTDRSHTCRNKIEASLYEASAGTQSHSPAQLHICFLWGITLFSLKWISIFKKPLRQRKASFHNGPFPIQMQLGQCR